MRRLVLVLVVVICAMPAIAAAQSRFRGSTPTVAPLSSGPAEAQILAVLERMVTSQATYLAVDADNGRMLRLLVESIGAKRAVEIGTSTGYSGLWTLLGLRATGGHLTTFEIDPGRAERARMNFREAGVDDLVTVVVGDAHENVKQLKEPIDLLFLDADKEGYSSYLRTLLPLLRPGGLIAADNIGSAPDYVQAVTTDPRLDTVFFGRFAVTMKKR